MELRITKNIEEANLITHTGSFHPDDVFSTMFLSKLVSNPVVCRVGSVNQVSDDKIVYDIGCGKFDHHGQDALMRNEKIKYCSFGLLWKEYGKEYLKKIVDESYVDDLFNVIDEKLIMQIDGIDNGLFPKIDALYKLMDLDKIIDSFNKTWDEEVDNDDYFMEAVSFVEIIFNKLIKREVAKLKAAKKVEEEINNVKDNILILKEYMPYQDAIFDSVNEKAKEVLVVIFPSNRGGYGIKPMTKNKDTKDLICMFNKEWCGLTDDELVKASGIKGAKFIHSSGFLATAETLEDAILLARNAISNMSEEE